MKRSPLKIIGLLCVLAALAMLASACSDDKQESVSDEDGDSEAADDDTESELDAESEPDAETEAEIDYEPIPIAPWQEERQIDYLTFACAEPLGPGSVTSLMAHLICEQRGMAEAVPANSVPDDAWDSTFDKMWRLEDTSDFDALRLVNLLYAFRGHQSASETLWQKVDNALLTFKFWFTDPTPEREADGEPVVDTMWYWSENHVLIFRTVEYLSGQLFPNRTFAVTGLTGREHQARARVEILKWLDERSRWGFTEWHSDVYYNWDMNPLLSLVEWAEDPEIARDAMMVLDLVWLDVALHLHRGNFGVTHGRSYIKDKPAAELQDTFDATRLFFDDTSLPYRSTQSGASVLFSRAEKYALPYVIRAIAKSDAPLIDRERMNLPLDERPPAAWDDPVPAPPYGLSYTGERDLALWWSMSGFVAWPVLPMMLEMADRYNLWEGQFKDFAMVHDLIGLGGDQPPMKTIHPIYKSMWRVLSGPILAEVNTYTYRTAHVMLSSAQDYRAGQSSNQAHAWQATLAERAAVFTTHPARLPVPEGEPIPPDWTWGKYEEPGPAYWTGSASRPRSAQHENVAIHIYAPQFKPKPLGLEQFDYREETHAYFPHAHFDEVIQDGPWTFGRKDDGFVALYSYRPTTWREGQPEVYLNDGKPFDLVAEGGAQNAWIVEVGGSDEWESFAAFVQAIAASRVTATPIADQDDDDFDDGFDMEYDSPSQGLMRFGWHGPLTVNGEEVAIAGYPRYDNPFVHVEFDATRYDVALDEYGLLLDFAAGRREFTEPAEAE
ncbi:MAG: hypothetical protein C4523_10010 [Myxococcales bacterium]|nr:MAG: hypothetical protein C4523_10010 [Myxococcales bacterium]